MIAAGGAQVPRNKAILSGAPPPVVSPAGFPRLGRKRWHKPAYKWRTPAAAI